MLFYHRFMLIWDNEAFKVIHQNEWNGKHSRVVARLHEADAEAVPRAVARSFAETAALAAAVEPRLADARRAVAFGPAHVARLCGPLDGTAAAAAAAAVTSLAA